MERLFANHFTDLFEEDSKDLVQLLFDAFNDHNAMVLTKADGTIILTNNKYGIISGYSKEDSEGSNISILESNYFPKPKWDHIFSEVKSGNSWNGVVRFKNKEGKFFWTSNTIMVIRESNSDLPPKFLYIMREISQMVLKSHQETINLIESIENKFESHADYLHEEIAQLVFGIKFKINGIKAQLESSEKCVFIKNELAEIELYAEKSLKKIKDTAFEMMPRSLMKEGLNASLESLINKQYKELYINATFQLKHSISKVISVTIYKIIERILDNCKKSNVNQAISMSMTSNYDFIFKIYIPNQSKIDIAQLKIDKNRINLLGGTLHTSSERGMFLIEITFEPRVAFEKVE